MGAADGCVCGGLKTSISAAAAAAAADDCDDEDGGDDDEGAVKSELLPLGSVTELLDVEAESGSCSGHSWFFIWTWVPDVASGRRHET